VVPHPPFLVGAAQATQSLNRSLVGQASIPVDTDRLARIRERERALTLDTIAPYEAFAERTARYREEPTAFLREIP
jgi:hypothetical protein